MMMDPGQKRRIAGSLTHFMLDYIEYSFAVGMIVSVMFTALMVLTVILMLVASSQTGVEIAGSLFEMVKPLLMILFPEGIHFQTGEISVVGPFLLIAFFLTIIGNAAKAILKRFGVEIKLGFFRKLVILFAFISACHLFLVLVVPGFEDEGGDNLSWYLVLGILYFITMLFSGLSLVASAIADLIRKHMDEPMDDFLIKLFPDK
jgi:hypothetical protein